MIFESKTRYYSSIEVEQKAVQYCHDIIAALEKVGIDSYISNPIQQYYGYDIKIETGKSYLDILSISEQQTGYRREGNGILYVSVGIRLSSDRKIIRETKTNGIQAVKVAQEVKYQIVQIERDDKAQQERAKKIQRAIEVLEMGHQRLGKRYGPITARVDDDGRIVLSGRVSVERFEQIRDVLQILNEESE